MTETKQLTKDRNYYRMLTNAELIKHVKGITNPTELERVLAERLREKSAGNTPGFLHWPSASRKEIA